MTDNTNRFDNCDETGGSAGDDRTDNAEQREVREFGGMIDRGLDKSASGRGAIVGVSSVFTQNGQNPRGSSIL